MALNFSNDTRAGSYFLGQPGKVKLISRFLNHLARFIDTYLADGIKPRAVNKNAKRPPGRLCRIVKG